MNHKLAREIDWRIHVFDSLSFPTLVLTPERRIVSVNRKFLEKFGAAEQDIIGKTCRDIFQKFFLDYELPCADRSCPLDQTLKEGVGHSILREIRGPGGRSRWEDRVFSPILDETGKVVYVIESVRDVTRTKRLEQMIHGIREFLDRIIQSSPSAIVAADKRGHILLMNQAAEDLFGYAFENLNGVTTKDLYPEGVAHEIMKKLRDDQYGGRGKLPVTQVTIRTARGEEIPVEMAGAIIYESDLELATMGIYNDLRERIAVSQKLREAEAQIVQSEKMASLGRLAAGVAHEINNPLTGILMYGNLLREKTGEESPLQTYLKFILEDAERCRDIVQNLLAYSRQSSTAREITALNELVQESLRLIRDQKLFLQVTIEWQLSQEPLQVFADRKKMRQVIINLVINAIDAMERKGVLTLRTYGDPSGSKACLEVEDTGCGIPPKNLTHIFDPFFTTKQPGQGTGLGLSTAYGIVNDNEGAITVKRTGTGGTVFLVTLPLADSISGMPDSIG